MSNYKETTGTGTTWRRSNQVIINNEYTGPKTIMFFEEDVAIVGDRLLKTPAGMLRSTFDSEYLIQLRDLETGEKTGNVIPQSLVYQALHSLYLDLAERRDANPEGLTEMFPG